MKHRHLKADECFRQHQQYTDSWGTRRWRTALICADGRVIYFPGKLSKPLAIRRAMKEEALTCINGVESRIR